MTGRPKRMPEGMRGRHVRLPVALLERLDAVAAERCVSSNLIVTKALEHYLDGLAALDARIAAQQDPQGRTSHG